MRRTLLLIILCMFYTCVKAQVFIYPKKGNPIKAEMAFLRGDSIVAYVVDHQELTMYQKDVVKIRFPESTLMLNPNPIIEKQTDNFVFAKGKRVYVVINGEDYNQAGARTLKDLLCYSDFWPVVDNVKDADFLIEYKSTTRGSDNAWFVFENIDGEIIFDVFDHTYINRGESCISARKQRNKYKTIGISESIDDNQEAAFRMFHKIIKPIQEEIEEAEKKGVELSIDDTSTKSGLLRRKNKNEKTK